MNDEGSGEVDGGWMERPTARIQELRKDGRQRGDPMTCPLIEDSRLRPHLFDWHGPVESGVLDAWLEKQSLHLPVDLLEVWRQTGGGEMFETEALLAPFGEASLGDDVLGVNAAQRSRGMPSGYLLFHAGMCLSAVRLSDGVYVTFKPESFEEESKFPSFDEWYQRLIRDEYSERYGLMP